jgi:hypothetical protein
MTIPRKLFFLTLLSIAASLACLVLSHQANGLRVLGSILASHMGTDSSRFMNQAWDTVQLGQMLYRTLFFDRHVKFIYPTSSLILYWVAALFHGHGGSLIRPIVLLSFPATLYVAGEVFLRRASETTSSEAGAAAATGFDPSSRIYIRLLIAALGILFYPLIFAVRLGQIQTLLTFLWTLAVWLWMTHRKALSGVCIALICVFKPTLAVFLLWAVFRREWRFLSFFAATAAAFQVLAIALFGWRNELDYLAVLSFLSYHGEAYLPNQTVNGLLERWTQNGNATDWSDFTYPPYNRVVYLGTLVSSALLLLFGIVVPVLLRWKDRSLDFLLFGMISTVASPIAWDHHYGYFFVGCIVLLASFFGQSRVPVFFIACFLVLSHGWPLLAVFWGRLWGPLFSICLFAALGILGTAVVQLSGTRRGQAASR